MRGCSLSNASIGIPEFHLILLGWSLCYGFYHSMKSVKRWGGNESVKQRYGIIRGPTVLSDGSLNISVVGEVRLS